jgi:Skp family chaperone for outer membrane proteins
MKRKLILAIFAAMTISLANAQVNKRQRRQNHRVEQGVQSGELTQQEQNKIEHQEAKVDNLEEKLRADGDLSKKDKAKLDVAQDRTSRSIYRKKHNKRDRN